MKPTMPLGDFLVAYLQRAGVEHIFGLPGDLVLGLFHRFGATRGLEIVTLSHEPAVGFAADGYARSTRRLGVVCVTYGAGGHNVINPVAGAYAEHVPLLVVSGGPGEAEQKAALIHHQVKDIASQSRIFGEVCCCAEVVERPAIAAEQIHEVVGRILTEMRPGYLEIHRDMVDVKIPVPKVLRDWQGSFPRPKSDARKLAESVAEAVARLRSAKRPAILAGVGLFRERAEADFRKLAEKLGAPVASTVLGKGAFPMDHPLYMGIHMGAFSNPEVHRRYRDADLVLALGAERTDLNQGPGRSPLLPERSVWALDDRVEASFHEYSNVRLYDFVKALGKEKLPRFKEKVVYRDNLKRSKAGRRPNGRRRAGKLSVNDMLVELNDFLAKHGDYHVVAESGDMLFGGLELRLHGRGLYFAQGYYASMGFAVPAALGAEIGTGLRPLVLVGDGGFQMTGPEMSHANAKGLSPLVVLVNNAGWGIFRPVTPRKDLLEIPPWPYAEFAQGWGGLGIEVGSAPELREALEAAHSVRGPALIECRLPSDDLSPLGRRYIRGSARRAGI